MELASGSEYTATQRMFNSLQARIIRTAISPRLATSIFSNMRRGSVSPECLERPDLKDGLPKLNWLGVIDKDVRNYPSDLCFYLIHDLHRFDNAHDCIGINLTPHFHVIRRFRRRCPVKRSNHRRLYLQLISD